MLIQNFLIAFSLTNIFEFLPFYFIIKPKNKEIFFLLFINIISLPIVWFFILNFSQIFLKIFIFSEIFAIFIESFLIYLLIDKELKVCFKASIFMNLFSAVIGLFIL